MLRPFDDLVRFLRRHSPGARERLALRLLESIVRQPAPRVVPARPETAQGARVPARY